MKAYQTKIKKLTGTSYEEVMKKARHLYHIEERRTKRQAYVRSAYFKKDKVFLNQFWSHLSQKRQRDRKRRLYYYSCAIDLIRHSRIKPVAKPNPNKPSEIVHRFVGITREKEVFFVQIAENKKTANKYFMSVFPPD